MTNVLTSTMTLLDKTLMATRMAEMKSRTLAKQYVKLSVGVACHNVDLSKNPVDRDSLRAVNSILDKLLTDVRDAISNDSSPQANA